MGMGMLVLRMTREGLRACPPDVGSSGVYLPARLGRWVVRHGVESVGEAESVGRCRVPGIVPPL